MTGATALAEGGRKFKVDVDLIFNNLKSTDKKYILRTVFDSLRMWKTKYSEVNVSPRNESHLSMNKEYAIIDGEVWVFRIDATVPQDLVAAINIAVSYYNVSADVFMSDIYIKNMNAESEDSMTLKALVGANKTLYRRTCEAVRSAAKMLSTRGELRLHVFSNNRNPKIPKNDMHNALFSGGADSVKTDPSRYEYLVSKNDNSQSEDQKPFFTHHHVAVFDL